MIYAFKRTNNKPSLHSYLLSITRNPNISRKAYHRTFDFTRPIDLFTFHSLHKHTVLDEPFSYSCRCVYLSVAQHPQPAVAAGLHPDPRRGHPREPPRSVTIMHPIEYSRVRGCSGEGGMPTTPYTDQPARVPGR